MTHQLRVPGWRPHAAGRRANDIDHAAVHRACHGDLTIRLTRDETRAAVDHLTRTGRNATQIAVVLGIHRRTVQRHRNALKGARP